VDVLVLLQLPHAGDDLQAIKKGIIELADVVVISKADIDRKAAELAQQQFSSALSMLRRGSPHWRSPVLRVSAASFLQSAADDVLHQMVSAAGTGMDDFWAALCRYRDIMTAAGEFDAKRQRQAVDWMWTLIDHGLRSRFRDHPKVRSDLDQVR